MRVAVKLTPREVAAVRAALRHVQHDVNGPSELARIELDEGAWLADSEIDCVIGVLTNAAEVIVIAASGAGVQVDDHQRQLLREAYELLNDPESRLNVRDWTHEARKVLRASSTAVGLPL